MPDVEAAVEDYYRRIQIPEHTVQALRSLITAQFSQLHATVKQARNAHVLERDDLQAERSKLLQPHYAGAVPLDLLKSEQDRIGRRLAFLEAQIEAGDMEYELASAHLDDCLALGRDCYKLCMSIDDSLRRIAKQAFFDRLYLSEEGTVIGEPGNRSTRSSTLVCRR
ncbi:hypothetical protein HMPREF3172_09710 [Brevibacterium sp. HMSC08F02]|uniref:hypothetical protein n=1 Tax=Brevibacterium sp. HMSC08F02 TaxID=1581140 RepID=UPI0008A4790F|nr:hypothetical protein [Brevibacterium sp. HMSC08F02]OFT24869.1 hypothetical protein HMPREF3172_09710 [Brevibacterium sp. HMSC08F02]